MRDVEGGRRRVGGGRRYRREAERGLPEEYLREARNPSELRESPFKQHCVSSSACRSLDPVKSELLNLICVYTQSELFVITDQSNSDLCTALNRQ